MTYLTDGKLSICEGSREMESRRILFRVGETDQPTVPYGGEGFIFGDVPPNLDDLDVRIEGGGYALRVLKTWISPIRRDDVEDARASFEFRARPL